MDIEQARRDLKASQPELYAYIRATEQAAAYSAAGDLVSGALTGEAAANRCWSRAVKVRAAAIAARNPLAVPEGVEAELIDGE